MFRYTCIIPICVSAEVYFIFMACFQAECYHYLLDACIKLYQLGIDWTTPEHGPINSAKRLHSILSPEIPNGCHVAESSKVISVLIFLKCHVPHLYFFFTLHLFALLLM